MGKLGTKILGSGFKIWIEAIGSIPIASSCKEDKH